uniref:Uncharacterized protein n=1 Tax=Zea mays TaxID=4577 RepID=C0PD19_MAIZE|nr:unknown [Zea mays]
MAPPTDVCLQGAVRVPGPEDRVPRGGVLEPRLLRGAGGVRGRRRRRGAGGPDGVQDGARPADGAVDADARVLGLRLAHGHQPPHAAALLHPHPQRVRQDARRQQRHPGQLAPQHLLPLLRPVQLTDRDPCPARNWSWLAGALLGSVTIVYSTILCSTTTRLLLLLLVYYHQVRRNGTASRRRRPWEGRCLRSPCRCSCIVIMVLGVVASGARFLGQASCAMFVGSGWHVMPCVTLIASRQARRQKN